MLRIVIALTAASLAAGAGAQMQPSAVRANNEAAAQINARQDAQQMRNMDARSQYSQDLAAYDSAMMRHDRRTDRRARRYRQQQRAYASAMRDWRQQTYACHHGNNRACNAPSPNPANYY